MYLLICIFPHFTRDLSWNGDYEDETVGFSGRIPDSVTNCPNIETLYDLVFYILIYRDLAGNRLTGSIPENIGYLTTLNDLYKFSFP